MPQFKKICQKVIMWFKNLSAYSVVSKQIDETIFRRLPRIAGVVTSKFGSHELALNVYQISQEIQDSIYYLSSNSPQIISSFLCAFEERANDLQMVESHGENGLALALTETLWWSPPSKFPEPTNAYPQQIPGTFLDRFSSAVQTIRLKHPDVLIAFKENQKKSGLQPKEYLGRVLSFYAHNKSVVPY